MKTAKVIPLFKNGDKDNFTNYRPVYLLSQFSKIIEKLFNNRLDTFIEKTDVHELNIRASQFFLISNLIEPGIDVTKRSPPVLVPCHLGQN